MLGVWLVYLIVLPLTLVAGVLATPAGRRQLRKIRHRQWRKGTRATTSAIKARRDAKLQTARGQLKAKRREQPYRIGIGHRRAEGDETRIRKAATAINRKVSSKARSIWYQYKVNKANRDSAWKYDSSARTVPKPGSINSGSSKPSSATNTAHTTLCGAETKSGSTCRNPVLSGKRCYAHQGPLS